MNKDFNSFDKELRKAILEHGKDHIDIFLYHDIEDNATIYGVYCSRKNSFSVTDTYSINIFAERDAQVYADSLGIGLCET